MRRAILTVLILGLVLTVPSCGPSPRSHPSYDQICNLVAGKTAAEVEQLLGKPDVRQTVLDDQRWIWWNYTYLDGDQYAPEVRGQVVHLEITFRSAAVQGDEEVARWRVSGPLAVSYSRPAEGP